MTTAPQHARVLTLLFSDLADSTALKSQHGDIAIGQLIARHREHVAALAERHAGRIIDWAGDGCFLTFDTSSAAVAFALRLQQIHHHETTLPGVRIGIHMGEVTETTIQAAPRIEGLAVDLAARVSGLAQPGQVLVTSAVDQSARQRIDIHEFGQPIRWESYGPYTLKGFDEPLDIRESGLDGLSPFMRPGRSEKAWPADDAEGHAAIRKLAVLPFTNLSGNKDQNFFVDGMTEAIITELAKIGALRVISRTSILQYRNTEKPLKEIAQELDVDALVEGSVLRADNDVRITAQLIHAQTDEHLWADSYDANVANVLRVQKDVALAIADSIKVAVSKEERSLIDKTHMIAPDAYERYLKARRFGRSVSPKQLQESIDELYRVTELAPDFPDTYSIISFAHWMQSIWGYAKPAEAFPAARATARTALRLDPDHVGAHNCLGWVATSFEWDWPEAEHHFLRALELDASYTWSHTGLSYLYGALGRFDEALDRCERARQVDPNFHVPRQMSSVVYFHSGDAPGAVDQIKATLAIYPDSVPALTFGVLAAAHIHDFTLSETWAEHALATGGPQTHLTAHHAYARALAGDQEFAQHTRDALLAQREEHFVLHNDLALIHLALGDHDDAIRELQHAYATGEYYTIWLNSFIFTPLRDHPRFQAILQKMNFQKLELPS